MNYDVVEVVIDKTVTTLRLKEWQYDIEEIVEHIAEGLKLIGAAKVYEDKVAVLTVKDKVARLPKDCQHIKEVDLAHPYKESGSFIEIDMADGATVTVLYQAMPVDTRGYVLVPDSAAVREALMWYLIKILILQGEVTSVSFQYAEQEWQWRCGSARADLNVWSPEQAYRIYQERMRLNPTKEAHLSNYKTIGRANTLDRERNQNNNIN